MEGLRINELLANGYFKTKTARSRSPSRIDRSHPPTPSSNVPSFLQTPTQHAHRERSRSRSRGPRQHPPPPPPRPIVEDEVVSLARESAAEVPTYDPPLRGKIDQNPILLEAEVTAEERAILQETDCPKDIHGNPDRRFVFIPKADSNSGTDEEGRRKRQPREKAEPRREEPVRNGSKYEPGKYDPRKEEQQKRPEIPRRESRREERRETRREEKPEKPPRRESRRDVEVNQPHPPIERRESRRDVEVNQPHPPTERRRSRQDLPTLETKVPREIPPQFRRSVSAFASSPRAEETPKPPAPRTPAEHFLSPEAIRPTKEYFSQSVPRQQAHDALWGKIGTPTDKRNSGGISGSRPVTPSSDKDNRNSGNFEKLTRKQQLVEEVGGRPRRHSPERGSGRSSRSSTHRKAYYSNSEDDITDSDSDRHRRHLSHRLKEDSHLRSPSKSNRSSVDLKGSRLSSPLPSPKISPSQIPRGEYVERAETFPQSGRRKTSRDVSPNSETPRGERLNPVEVLRPRSRAGDKRPAAPSHASMPIPTPSRIDLHSFGETRKSPSIPQFGVANSWQPPPVQPPSQNLDKPVGSFRRYSQDIEQGSVAPLPLCPRMHFTRGRNDWLTLPQCPSFDICPSCFNSIIAPTEFRNLFIPAARRPPEVEVLCDFGSSPWYRIAWLLTLKEHRRDLNLFYGLADIGATYPPCLGKHEAVRKWHSVIDYKTGAPVRGFDVCHSCVKSVEVLLPNIRGVFVRLDTGSSPRICDLRFDSKRFVQYFDALETAADHASFHPNKIPDTRDLASLARRFAQFEECQHDRDLLDRRWHIITQLPEFTVCEECFEEVVWPELEEDKAIPLMFNKTMQRISRASCQLYSPRMRGIFRLAVDSGDYKMLVSKARERKSVEVKYKGNLGELRRQKSAGILNGNGIMEREVARLEEEWRKWE